MTQPDLAPDHAATRPALPGFAVKAVKAALHTIPMNATVGVQITDVGVGWAEGACADTAPFRNHLGTIHAGAQFLLAEAVSGAAFAGAFAAQLAQAVPLIEKLETHYVARARGDITAQGQIDPATLPAAYAEFAEHGKARLVVNVTVKDAEDKAVMRAVAHWYLRASGGKSGS
jgi:acyl-coenzyme A thioesterase PaaI-like protein